MDADGTVRLWDPDVGLAAARACRVLGDTDLARLRRLVPDLPPHRGCEGG